MTCDKQIEGENLKERRVRESKRCYFEGGFSNSKIDGVSGLFQQGQKLKAKGYLKLLIKHLTRIGCHTLEFKVVVNVK